MCPSLVYETVGLNSLTIERSVNVQIFGKIVLIKLFLEISQYFVKLQWQKSW